MDILSIIISLISGIVGGNIAGAAAPDKSLGALGNSVAGLFGGGIGGYILKALGILAAAQATGGASQLDIGSILANVGSSGVGGALLMFIVSYIKNATQK